ncbi:MAG: N-acetyltransferase [Calditrichaeota bacterium]|nr:MAG: N-acetyltransferase [Calditrichota bacterium]
MIKIETERLILREYRESDWEAVHIYSQQEEILVYEAWGPNTEEETKAFVNRSIDEKNEIPRKGITLAITLKNEGKLIGGCGFRINEESRNRGYFGYIINPNFWNQGFATEACKALLSFVVKEFAITEIEAKCDALNVPSQKVLEKCGLKVAKRFKQKKKVKGRFPDTLLFQKSGIK